MSDRLIFCVKPNNSPKGTLISGVDFSVSTTRSHSTLHRYTMRLTEIAC